MPDSILLNHGAITTTKVIACVDQSDHAASVVSTASRLAEALDAPLTVFQVIEADGPFLLRPDPVDSEFQRHQSRRRLERLIDANPRTRGKTQIEFVEGESACEICRRAEEPGTMLVIGNRGERETAGACGSTAQRVLECASAPLMMVPADSAAGAGHFHRLLVPLDGSNFAETALVQACRIARRTGAEIILTHVVPTAELTQVGPLDMADIELRERLTGRNERIGRAYLERQRQRLADQGFRVRAICKTGNVRVTLAQVISEQNVDLVVLSARGQGARNCVDLPYGSVAAFLLAHAHEPLLMVRPIGLSAASKLPPPPLMQFQPISIHAS